MPTRRRLATSSALALAFAGALATRAGQLHDALLYPDSYQYLLMARGIAEHGRPIVRLGPGGDLFVPNVDASLKPLFPALVALGHLLGFGWIDTARAITAIAGASCIVLCGLLARRLAGSWTSGLIAGALCLASPALGYWGGFVGPDALAPTLGLAATLALLDRRFAAGGVLVAGCVATRPEYLALAGAAALAAALEREARPALVRVATSTTFALAALLVTARPPLVVPEPRLLIGGLAASAAAGTLVAFARREGIRGPAWALAVAAAAGTALLSSEGLRELLSSDWPLVVAGGAGFVAALARRPERHVAISLALAASLLAGIYFAKNPDLERYLVQLVPLLALLGGIGAGRLWAAALYAPAVLLLALAPGRAEPGVDAFAATARAVQKTPGPVVTAAPDAYGFLLYPRTVRRLRVGASGLVVLDAAQRLFEPNVRADGRVVRRIFPGDGLLRPDGVVDRKPTLLVRGSVDVR